MPRRRCLRRTRQLHRQHRAEPERAGSGAFSAARIELAFQPTDKFGVNLGYEHFDHDTDYNAIKNRERRRDRDPFAIEEDATSFLRQDGYRGSVELVFDTDSDLRFRWISSGNEPTRRTPRTATARLRRHRFLPVCQPTPAIERSTRDGLPLVGTSSTTPRASSTCSPPATRPCSGSWARTTSTRTFRCISCATTTTLWTSFRRRRRFSRRAMRSRRPCLARSTIG